MVLSAAKPICAAAALLLVLVLMLLQQQQHQAAALEHREMPPQLLRNYDVLYKGFMNTQIREKEKFKPIMEIVEMISEMKTSSDVLKTMVWMHIRSIPCGIDVPSRRVRNDQITLHLRLVDSSAAVAHLDTVRSLAYCQKSRGASPPPSVQTIADYIRQVQSSVARHLPLERDSIVPDVDMSPLRFYRDAFKAKLQRTLSLSTELHKFIQKWFGDDTKVPQWKAFLMWSLLREMAPFLTHEMAAEYLSLRSNVAQPAYLDSQAFGRLCGKDPSRNVGIGTTLDQLVDLLSRAFAEMHHTLVNSRSTPSAWSKVKQMRCPAYLQYDEFDDPKAKAHIVDNLWTSAKAQHYYSVQPNIYRERKYNVVCYSAAGDSPAARGRLQNDGEFAETLRALSSASSYSPDDVLFAFQMVAAGEEEMLWNVPQIFAVFGYEIAKNIASLVQPTNHYFNPALSWDDDAHRSNIEENVAFSLVRKAFELYLEKHCAGERVHLQWKRFRSYYREWAFGSRGADCAALANAVMGQEE